jgi:hypothetical protein
MESNKPIAPQIVVDAMRNKYGTGIHGLINYRASFVRSGIIVFGKFGQGVRSNGARLDLCHAALVVEEQRVFGACKEPLKAFTVARTFGNEEQANRYYLKLCNTYHSVKLLRAPFFGAGQYAWEVATA